MCKIMLVAGIKTEKVPLVHKLAKNMAKAMSVTEKDGVGYAAITKTGRMYGEKWLNNADAFVVHTVPPVDKVVEQIETMFGETIEWDKKPVTMATYEAFGDRTAEHIKDTVALILHARSATQGEKNLTNVHPFIELGDDDTPITALIHNGSISNHDKLTKKYSTCDSEVILHEYIANQTFHNPWAVEQIAKTLVGTYAVGVLSSQYIDNKWVPYLEFFKSNRDLYGGYVPELETMVYATCQYKLENALKDSDMTLKNLFKVKDGYLHRFNATTGERLEGPVSFTTSSQYGSGYNTQHENSMAHRYNKGSEAFNKIFPYGPPVVGDPLLEAKGHFQRKHPALFTSPYLESELSADEKKVFDDLAKDNHSDHKALRLVSAALSAGRA